MKKNKKKDFSSLPWDMVPKGAMFTYSQSIDRFGAVVRGESTGETKAERAEADQLEARVKQAEKDLSDYLKI